MVVVETFFAHHDCEKLCGKVIDHKLLSSDEIQKRYESSVRAWDTYCSPEPYDFLASPTANPSYKSICGYDIAAAVQRQRNFNYQQDMRLLTKHLVGVGSCPAILTCALALGPREFFCEGEEERKASSRLWLT
ncbi:hypothetical protein ANCCAN_00757 [Ancylostoma caninum]|uniref:Uncharacterized protein n=1 Tax=Ancylostoma caninum TaxID=29170 RepID=A0A368H9B3_ANCCA|nr:hypothetical protein ANCCAN_00757 [Ancylostoma caninum]